MFSVFSGFFQSVIFLIEQLIDHRVEEVVLRNYETITAAVYMFASYLMGLIYARWGAVDVRGQCRQCCTFLNQVTSTQYVPAVHGDQCVRSNFVRSARKSFGNFHSNDVKRLEVI